MKTDLGKTSAGVVATFFGLGFFPVAPGTAGSLAAALLYRFFLAGLRPAAYLLMLAALFLFGAAASGAYARRLGLTDPGRIIIDEVCGQLAALFLVPPSLLYIAIVFFLFRLFDILKPFPIKKTESIPAGWGIMADDIAAALAAALLFRLARIFI
jgi:phosphatidylglycerophosphatase A